MKNFSLTAALILSAISGFSQKPGPGLLDPTNHALVLIDYEGQMALLPLAYPLIS
jgi:hypothetical protein